MGKPKSIVAREAVLAFNPAAKIIAHYGYEIDAILFAFARCLLGLLVRLLVCRNIKDKEFGVSYFKRFAVVLIALDNESARRHVNRMCLAAGVPLVEAGTMGFSGQAYPIAKGITACFECNARPVQKQYPICTIRR